MMAFPYRLSYFALVLVSVLGFSSCKSQKVQSMGGPPAVPVSVARASKESVPVEVRVVGSVEASETVQVRSQIAGELMSVHFTEGQGVAKDQLLFQIDPRPYREALRQAESAVVSDRAQLRQAEATLARDIAQAKNADAQAKRYGELSKAGVTSREQNETVLTSADVARQTVRASEAAVESARAALDSDISAVDRAKLDLTYCEIRSPLAGRSGNLLVHPGNLIKANDLALVVIHRISPIFVSFSVPERHLNAIRRLNERRPLGVRVSLKDEPGKAANGHLTVIDNSVDPATGTIRLKGVFDNVDRLLWPGQFVNIVLTLDTIKDATVIPAEAVQSGQQGEFVYRVKPDNTVEPRNVLTSRSFEKKTIVEKGIAPGDLVVTDGQLRLSPGAKIQAVDPGKLAEVNLQ